MIVDTSESDFWVEDPKNVKFNKIPQEYYYSWMKKANFDPLNKRILDFGCGSGLSTFGIAAAYLPEKLCGVDISNYINPTENRAVAEKYGHAYSELCNRIDFNVVQPLENLGDQIYDCILSWSVIEHVAKEFFEKQVEILFMALKKNGIAILQSSPLYFSPYGSHIYNLPPWAHLIFSEKYFKEQVFLSNSTDRAISLINCKETLNKNSFDNFTDAFKKVGFDILDVYSTDTDIQPSEELSSIYNKNVLMKEQGVWLLRRP